MTAKPQPPSGKVYRIGWLTPNAPPPPGPPGPSSSLGAFRQALRDLGYVEGQHFTIEARFSDAKLDRLPALAVEFPSSWPVVPIPSSTGWLPAWPGPAAT